MNYILYPGATNNELQNLLYEVSNYFNLNIEDLKSKSRETQLVIGRAVFCEAARSFSKANEREIGEIIKRDRTTVIHSYKSAKNIYKFGKQAQEFKDYYTQNKIKI